MLVNLAPKIITTNKKLGLQQKYNIYFSKNSNITSVIDSEIKDDSDKEIEDIDDVSIKEGIKLVGSGFLNKTKDLVLSVFKQPLKTIGVVGATSLALGALPLIGITSATGASALALGFATIAVGKTVKDSINAFKHNENNNYNELRNDLKNIGGDGVDLALTLPFVPKAIKAVKDYAKFGSKMHFNKEFWSDLKSTKNPFKHIYASSKANLKLRYEEITNEMGLKVKPKLVIKKNMPNNIAGQFEPAIGELYINKFHVNPISKTLFNIDCIYNKFKGIKTGVKSSSTEGFLRHELEHFRQFSDIARTKNIGIDGLKKQLISYHQKRMPSLKAAIDELSPTIEALNNNNAEALNQKILARFIYKEYNFYKKEYSLSQKINSNPQVLNTKFYQKIIDSSEPINSSSSQAKRAHEYLEGLANKLEDGRKLEKLQKDLIQEVKNKKLDSKDFPKVFNNKLIDIYKSNPLEKEAYAAQDIYYDTVLKNRPGSINVISQAQSTTEKKHEAPTKNQ